MKRLLIPLWSKKKDIEVERIDRTESSFKRVVDHLETISYTVAIDEVALNSVVLRAARNKTGHAKQGPVHVQIYREKG